MNRRKVKFRSLEMMLGDAKDLQSKGYRSAGNWSLGQVCNHLAATIQMIDGLPVPRIFLRIGMGSFLKFTFLGKIGNGLGLRVPTALPQRSAVNDEAGISRLESALSCLSGDRSSIEAFHLWHCEHHLSFLVPNQSDCKNLDD